MKQMIQRMREEKGGFTLAELLIVVAIVAVLVAIAIPVFTAQLAKANAGTDEANVRSGWAQAQTTLVSGTADDNGTYILQQNGQIKKADASDDPYKTKGKSADLGTTLPSFIPAWTDTGKSVQYVISDLGTSSAKVTISFV